MTIRVAAVEGQPLACAQRRRLSAPPHRHAGRELVAIQDSDAGIVARRAAEVGSPPTFTDYQKMLAETRPDFVVALGRQVRWRRSPTTCSMRAIRF